MLPSYVIRTHLISALMGKQSFGTSQMRSWALLVKQNKKRCLLAWRLAPIRNSQRQRFSVLSRQLRRRWVILPHRTWCNTFSLPPLICSFPPLSITLLNGSLISSPWVKELGDLDWPHSWLILNILGISFNTQPTHHSLIQGRVNKDWANTH